MGLGRAVSSQALQLSLVTRLPSQARQCAAWVSKQHLSSGQRTPMLSACPIQQPRLSSGQPGTTDRQRLAQQLGVLHCSAVPPAAHLVSLKPRKVPDRT